MLKKITIIILTIIMVMSFSIIAYAEEIEVGKCDVSDPICAELQNKYGPDSSVLYSIVETDTCNTLIRLEIDGSYEDVYIAEPASNDATAPDVNGGDNIIDTGSDTLLPGLDGIEDIGSQLPNPTTDQILNWATTKGNEIIYMLQIFCQPFAILIFIIAAFMTLIGCIGKSDMVGKGVWGMVLSVVVYAAVLYAPVILQTFVGWIAS